MGDNGLFYYDAGKDSVILIYVKINIINRHQIFWLLTDVRGLQWFATEDGIRIWDKKSQDVFIYYNG